MPEVTVLIPCYNQVKYIETAIRSALSQGVDVMVYDDASTDGSSELLKNRGNITLISGDVNSGTTALPYNTMFRACESEFVVLLSADDALAPGAITLMKNNMDGYDWVYPNMHLIDTNDNVIGGWDYTNWPRDYEGMKEFIRMNHTSPAPFCGMIRKSFIDDNNLTMKKFDNINNGEDLRTLIDWIEYKPRIGFVPAYLYYYRRHPGGRSYGIMGNEILEYNREIDRLLGVNSD